MKAILDHIGIAVSDLPAALGFYRDALGLEVEAPEEVVSQRVRVHFIPVGEGTAHDRGAGTPGVRLELLEATAPDSPIAKYIEKRGPGLHHVTLRVDDVGAAVEHLKTRGVRLIDQVPRDGAEGSTIAFVHPAATGGVLIELKQAASTVASTVTEARGAADGVARYAFGNLELISVSDGFFRLDGGAMFGAVPKPLWSKVVPGDERNRVTLAMRPLIVRGARTMIIDAGIGDKDNERFHDIYGVDHRRHLDRSLDEAGVSPEDIDIVLATHLHFDHAGGFTVRDANGRVKPRFPRAQYVIRRGEWDDAIHPNARTHASYVADNYVPLADAGVLQFVDDDVTIMPGVRVRRTGGHTMHHQMVLIESTGRKAAFVSDMIPMTAHLSDAWIMGLDQYPMETMAVKQAFLKEAQETNLLVFFEHDPAMVAGYIRERDGKRTVEPAPTND